MRILIMISKYILISFFVFFLVISCIKEKDPLKPIYNIEYDNSCPEGQSPPQNHEGDEPIPPNQIDKHPSWSPDGNWIAYIHRNEELPPPSLFELRLINPETLQKNVILVGLSQVTWFPSSDSLVIVKGGDLYIIGLDGNIKRKLTNGGLNYYPDITPDGQWLAWDVDYWDIWIMNLETGQNWTIQKGSSVTGKSAWRAPSWSPDGSKLVHIRYGHYLPYGYETIYIMNSDGTDGERLTYYAREHLNPCWSLAGDMIAFVSRGCEWLRDIFIYDLTTNEIERLTFEGGDEPSWSPDGNYIVYSKKNWENYDPEKGSRTGFLHIINIHTKEDRQITFDEISEN